MHNMLDRGSFYIEPVQLDRLIPVKADLRQKIIWSSGVYRNTSVVYDYTCDTNASALPSESACWVRNNAGSNYTFQSSGPGQTLPPFGPSFVSRNMIKLTGALVESWGLEMDPKFFGPPLTVRVIDPRALVELTELERALSVRSPLRYGEQIDPGTGRYPTAFVRSSLAYVAGYIARSYAPGLVNVAIPDIISPEFPPGSQTSAFGMYEFKNISPPSPTAYIRDWTPVPGTLGKMTLLPASSAHLDPVLLDPPVIDRDLPTGINDKFYRFYHDEYPQLLGISRSFLQHVREQSYLQSTRKMSLSKLNLSMAALGGRQTLEMLRSALSRLSKRLFQGSASGKFANGWLEWNFGWEQLFSDVYELIQIVSGKNKGLRKGQFKRISGSHQEDFQSFNSVYGVRISNTNYLRVRQDISAWAAASGFRNPEDLFLLAWDLIPYSFVLDWVACISGYLQSLTNIQNYEYLFGTESLVIRGGYLYSPGTDYTDESGVFRSLTRNEFSVRHYSRIVLREWPRELTGIVSIDLTMPSIWQSITSAALLLQRSAR